MQNPYQPPTVTRTAVHANAESVQRRAFWLTVRVTVLTMLAATFPISSYINQTYRPNMGTWVIPYFLFVVIASFPIGLLAGFTARTVIQNLRVSFFAPLAASLGMALVPYFAIPAMKGVRIGLVGQTLLLLFWTSGAPFFIGITVYLFKSRLLANNDPDYDSELEKKN